MTTTAQQAPEALLRGGIDIERYAEVMAHIRHFGKALQPEVLERLALDEDRWEEALFGFTALLVEESEREEEALSRRFGERFAKTKARLGKEKPVLASIGPLRNEVADQPPAEVAVPAIPAAAPEPTPSPPIVTTPAAMPMPVLPTPNFVQEDVSPWAQGSSVMPTPAVVPPRVVAPVKPSVPQIQDMSFVPAGMRNFGNLHGTQGPSLDAAAKPALPFAEDAATADHDAAFRRAKELGEHEPVRPKPTPAEPATGETRDISAVVAAVMAQKKSTPFDKEKQAAKTAAPAASPPGPVVSPNPSAPVASPKPPAPITSPNPSAPVASPNPSPQAPTPASPESISLTIEQYASLCVEIAMTPAKRHEITQRYGLADEHAARIDAYWRGRIANEPEIDKAFRWAYHSYQQWLARR